MADVQGVNYAATFGSTPVGKVASNLNGGRIRVLHETYEAAAAAAGTDVLLGKLKEGAVIHDWLVMSDDLGTSVTFQLATRDDDSAATENAFSAATDVATAASVNRPVAADIARLPLTVDEDVTVIGKIAGGTATGTIAVWVFYSVD